MARLPVVLVGVLVCAVPGAAAARPWAKQNLAGAITAGPPQIDANDRGDVVAVAATDSLWAAVRAQGDARFREFAVPGSEGGRDANVAVGKTGLAAIAWYGPDDDRRVYRFQIGQRRSRRSQRVSLPGEEVSAFEPAPVAVSVRGTVATAWRSEAYIVVARARPGRTFEEPIAIAYEFGDPIALTFDSDDRLTVTWAAGHRNSELRSATVPARGRSARITTMAEFPAPQGGEFWNLNVGQDIAGDRVVIWSRLDGVVRAGRADPGGPLTQLQELEPSEKQFAESEPSLGVSRGGAAVAAWADASPNSELRTVRVALSTPGQPFSAPFAVAASGDRPAVAIGRQGRALVAWVGEGEIKARTLRPGSDREGGSQARLALGGTLSSFSAAVGADRFVHLIAVGPNDTSIYSKRVKWP